eukprot:Filipodium_phascolosomae@DN1206_c0_g1_i2.p2
MVDIHFYFDVVSPYAFLAFQCVKLNEAIWGDSAQVVLHPVFLGGVMKLSGNRPPGLVPPKARYMMQDLALGAAVLGQSAMCFPAAFPPNTLWAMRVLQYLHLGGRGALWGPNDAR